MKDSNKSKVDITRRRMLAATAVGGLAVTATGLAGFANPSLTAALAADRSVLTVGMSGFPPALEPVMYTHTATRRVVPQIYDKLLAFEPTEKMDLRPALAERWERIDNKSLRLFLRKGVKFHDGGLFTAEDVAFSLSHEHLNGPDRSAIMPILGMIDHVEIVDDFTVIVVAKGPDALLEKRLASWGAEMVSKSAFDAAGSWEKWIAAPVGTGPYKLESQLLDVNIVLIAHDDYWGGLPPFSGIEYRIIPQMASRLNALAAGEVDIVTDLSPDMFSQIEGNDALELTGGPVLNTRYLGIDASGPVLSKVGVRRALSLAIDRKTFVETLWQNRVPITHGFQFPSFGEGYIEDFPKPAFDTDLARQLLKEADYNGEIINYRLLNDYYPNQVIGAQTLIEMWRAVGINVEIQMMENFAQIWTKPVEAIFDVSSTAIFPDHLGHAWRVFGPTGTLARFGSWKNEEYFALGSRLQNIANSEARRPIIRQMLEIIQHNANGILLHGSGQFYGKRKDVPWIPGLTLDLDFGPLNPAFAKH